MQDAIHRHQALSSFKCLENTYLKTEQQMIQGQLPKLPAIVYAETTWKRFETQSQRLRSPSLRFMPKDRFRRDWLGKNSLTCRLPRFGYAWSEKHGIDVTASTISKMLWQQKLHPSISLVQMMELSDVEIEQGTPRSKRTMFRGGNITDWS